MTFGSWVRKQREKCGWTQEKLVEVTKISLRTIYNIERDRVTPIAAHRHLIESAFGEEYKEARHEARGT